jgi:hypothetical protein
MADLKYEPNPKHKQPYQVGRRGSLCPPTISLEDAARMLKQSDLVGNARYATSGGTAFCAREHRPGLWHGYPVSWHEVPPSLWHAWIEKGTLKRSEIRKNW